MGEKMREGEGKNEADKKPQCRGRLTHLVFTGNEDIALLQFLHCLIPECDHANLMISS